MKPLYGAIGSLFLIITLATSASANLGLQGNIYCDVNDNVTIDIGVDVPLNGVVVHLTSNLGFDGSVATGDGDLGDGYYSIALSTVVPQAYTAAIDPSTIPNGASVVQPATNSYQFTAVAIGDLFTRDFLVDSSACTGVPPGACWMTAGGVKFSTLLGIPVAERGPRVNIGGNVFPSCDSDPGQGGQWNHLDHLLRLHFQGFVIETVACGNVPGIEEGSESPVTPFNYIEFQGTGRIRGVKGNKLPATPAYFFARVEDRNEPGNENASAGEDIDRYFIHVYSDPGDPNGTTLLLTDVDGDPSTVDPVTITGGNLQLHASSCEE